MNIADALAGIQRLYLDTAPFIYYVEDHPDYGEKMQRIFEAVHSGSIEIVTSVVTLTETLAKPLKTGDVAVQQSYRALLQSTEHITLTPITAPIAEYAAEMRSQYNLRTPDALHIASAVDGACEAFLTNDNALRRIERLRMIVLDNLELDLPENSG